MTPGTLYMLMMLGVSAAAGTADLWVTVRGSLRASRRALRNWRINAAMLGWLTIAGLLTYALSILVTPPPWPVDMNAEISCSNGCFTTYYYLVTVGLLWALMASFGVVSVALAACTVVVGANQTFDQRPVTVADHDAWLPDDEEDLPEPARADEGR
jgi:hypothetical protein